MCSKIEKRVAGIGQFWYMYKSLWENEKKNLSKIQENLADTMGHCLIMGIWMKICPQNDPKAVHEPGKPLVENLHLKLDYKVSFSKDEECGRGRHWFCKKITFTCYLLWLTIDANATT